MSSKRLSKYTKITLSLFIITTILNIIAFSKSFCDWYANNIYPVLNAIIGSMTSFIPFAIGEIIMYIGAFMIMVFIISLLLLLFLFKKPGYRKYMLTYSKVCLLTIVVFLFLYTTNWFIPIRGNVLRVSNNTRTEYTVQELEQLRTAIVLNLNSIADNIERDADGHIIIDYTQQDITEYMRANAYRYSKLAGHYSNLKPAICSDILDFMNVGGYNYIYTMEPTFNYYCDDLFLPILLAHELCHHKGYYLENEAEFLSTIILAESDNDLFRYSAYLEMYAYINNAYIKAVVDSYLSAGLSEEDASKAAIEYITKQPARSQTVRDDILYAREKRQENYEKNVNKFVETNFKESTKEVADKGWQLQGDLLGENTYTGITLMLLQYYYSE